MAWVSAGFRTRKEYARPSRRFVPVSSSPFAAAMEKPTGTHAAPQPPAHLSGTRGNARRASGRPATASRESGVPATRFAWTTPTTTATLNREVRTVPEYAKRDNGTHPLLYTPRNFGGKAKIMLASERTIPLDCEKIAQKMGCTNFRTNSISLVHPVSSWNINNL